MKRIVFISNIESSIEFQLQKFELEKKDKL